MAAVSTTAGRFIHTNFLDRQKVKGQQANKRKISFSIIALGILTMVSFFAFLWIKIGIIETGYQISKTHQIHEQLIQKNRNLKIERASLASPARIEKIAKTKLGMRIPANSQMVILKW